MKRPKKFPTILLCFTLALAVFVTGITKPGFLLPLFRPNITEPTGSQYDIAPRSSIEGNSRAFSITGDTGFTISAPENALDRDREFSITRLANDVMEGFRQIAFRAEDLDTLPVIGWDVDAGMTADDLMPGDFRMDFDLAQIGIPEELYDDVGIFHIDDDGKWDQYVTKLNGSVLSVDANHNGPILLGILTWTLLATGFKLGFDYFVTSDGRAVAKLSFPVHEHDEIVGEYRELEGAVPVIEHYGSQLFTLNLTLNESIMEDQRRLKEMSKQITDECLSEAEESMKRDYGDNYMNNSSLKYPLVEKFKRIYALYSQKTGKGTEYFKTAYLYNCNLPSGGLYTWDSVLQMAKILRAAYFYIGNECKLKTPKYCPQVYMNAATSDDHTNTYLYTGRSFAILKTGNLGLDKTTYCKMLSSATHEVFHMCQREYCCKTRSTAKYDEAVTQLFEEKAYEFYKSHTLTTSYNGSSVSAVFSETSEANSLCPIPPDLGNGEQWHFMACLMDGTFNSRYTTWLNSDTDVFTMGFPASTGDSGYVYARFIDYLWKDYEKGGTRKMTWEQLVGAYRWYNAQPEVSTLLKQAFDYWEHDLTRKFKYFAEDSKLKFYNYGLTNTGQYYNPTVGSTEKNGGKIYLWDERYTIKTRYFKVYTPPAYNKMASLLLVQTGNLKSEMPDLTLIPVGNTECEPCKHGLFYRPQSVADLQKGAILEVDGGTYEFDAPFIPTGRIPPGYELWTLLAPDEITPEVKDGQLRFKMPEKSDACKKELIDGYRVTITASTSPEKPYIEYFTTGIAGSERSINVDKIIPKELIERAREDDLSDTVSFTVSVCEYIKDPDGKVHYGPESNPRSSMNALLSEMGAHEGRITVTLHWYGRDDLDLHCITPQGGHISYSNKSEDGGYLDVDMNIDGDRTESVEHIYFDEPDAGDYKIYVVNYTDRTEGDCTAEIYISVEGKQIIADTASMGSRSKTWKFRTTSAVLAESGGQYLIAEPLASEERSGSS